MQLFKRKNKTKTITNPEISIDKNNLIEINGKNYYINDVACVEFRQFYDSTWRISLVEVSEGAVKNVELIRYDTETKENLINLLNKTHSIEELLSLNDKENIYYD